MLDKEKIISDHKNGTSMADIARANEVSRQRIFQIIDLYERHKKLIDKTDQKKKYITKVTILAPKIIENAKNHVSRKILAKKYNLSITTINRICKGIDSKKQWKHGTCNGYNYHKCRCPACKEANNVACLSSYYKRKSKK